MNIFTKLTLTGFIGIAAAGINAQNLGEAVVINPYPASEYQTFLQAVTVAWNFQMITLTDQNATCKVTFNNKTFDIYADPYFDPEVAWDLGQTNSDLAWGNELVIDFSEEAYAEGRPLGEYIIEIPEGFVKNEDGETNAYQKITFTIVDLVDPVSCSPKNGLYPADELKNVTVTFDGQLKMYDNWGLAITARKKNDWISQPTYITSYKISEDGKSLVIDLSTLPSGILYDVEIPANFMLVGDYHMNNEVWLEYMIWEGMEEAILISAPEPESSPDLKPFIMTWDYQQIIIPDNAPETELVCGYPDYGEQDGWRKMIPSNKFSIVYVDEKGNVTMNPGAEQVANALYFDVKDYTVGYEGYPFEISFPAGLVENEAGLPNPPFTYNFTVRNLWADPTITTEEGVMTLLWQNSTWVTYNLGTSDIILTNEAGEKTILSYNWGVPAEGEVGLLNERNKHGITIDLSNLSLENGRYILSLPQGYVGIDGSLQTFVLNAALEVQFTWENGNFKDIAGIESLKNDETWRIYNINGTKVSNMQNLKPGIYIINGKKIMIK